MDEPAVRFEGITRRFPGALALDDVTLEVGAGTCHALCGENGAGKSTLGRILAGIHLPNEGRVLVHGRTRSNALRSNARRSIPPISGQTP